MTQQQRVTRKPTGKPGWPFVLIAGGEKCGKTWSAAEFTTSPLLGRTFWIEVGEDTADLYGALPGANYEIVEHDGTYRDILDALTWVTQQPRVNGKPNGIVFDSLSVLWELLGNEQQRVANDRAMEKARKYSRRMPTEEARVTTDLWNDATDRWYGIIKLLKGHDGPVVATARLEQVTAMGDDGQPTKEKWWKVAAQKRLRNDATATVEMREPQKAELWGTTSIVYPVPPGRGIPLPGFKVHDLLLKLGMEDPSKIGAPTYVSPNAAAVLGEGQIDADELEASVAAAVRDGSEDALIALGNRHGREALALTEVSDPDGARVSGAQLIDSAIAYVRANRAHAEVDVRATEPDARAQQQAPAAQPARTENAQPAQGARALSPDDERLLLRKELAGQTAVRGISADAAQAAFRDIVGVSTREASLEQLRDYVFMERTEVIELLKARGEATAAAYYERAQVAGIVATWDELVGAHAQDAADAQAVHATFDAHIGQTVRAMERDYMPQG